MTENKIPEPILENLRKYDTHHNATCLNCGYSGLMGYTGNSCPWYLSWIAILAVVLVFSYFIPLPVVAIVPAVILGGAKAIMTKKNVTCPSCNTDLLTK